MDRILLIAYAAGLVDGEGCISTSCGTNSSVRIAVAMCTPQGPNLMRELFGGTVRLHIASKSGFGRRPQFRWEIRAQMAENALVQLRPFLREKQAQADVALQLREIQRGHRGAHSTKDKAALVELRSTLRLLKKPA